MMDAMTLQALAQLSDNGFWAVFWWAFFMSLPSLIFVIALVVGVRAFWKYQTKNDGA